MRCSNSLAALLAFTLIGAIAPVALAHDAPAAPSSNVKPEILMWIQDAEDKLGQLAEATPEAKFSYRPGKGVRSTAEVFMHVAAANYGIPSFWGVKPPAGYDMQTFETSKTKKAEIQKELKDSFAHMKAALGSATDEELSKPVEFFGMKSTVRGAYLLLLSHAHEHLGQSIAYARVNGIVPPWTAKQQAGEKQAEAKKSE